VGFVEPKSLSESIDTMERSSHERRKTCGANLVGVLGGLNVVKISFPLRYGDLRVGEWLADGSNGDHSASSQDITLWYDHAVVHPT